VVTNGTADTDLAPGADSRLADVNPDPTFPNAPGFRAVGLLADEAFTGRFRPRVVSATLAVACIAGCVVTGIHGHSLHTGAGGVVAAADHATHGGLLAMIRDQSPPRR
jgi:myo-inositol-1(or 4)-monophosphatase